MSARSPAGLWIFFAFAAVVLPAAFVLCNIPGSLTLERAFPTSHGVELNHLRARDRARHGRMLQAASGVVDFPVEGTYDPYLVGLYFTRVQLGSPPKEFYVQIDTGSDVLWVGCKPCSGCPTSSGLQIPLEFFDPKSSPTASPVSCSDSICEVGAQSSDTVCSSKNDQCSYTFQYGDGSGTSGYYVADLLHLNTVVGNTITSNSTVPVVFGCSTSQTGDLMKSDRAVDGIFGFGQQGLSVISQLSSQGIVPNSFSHCLKGSNGGGGILVFGSIINPNLVYSPLVPSMPHYNLNLQSISVNGRSLAIDPSVFATSVNKGTIIDCGTTLAYLAEEAYDPFVNAITATISQNVRPVLSNGSQCFLIDASVSDIFPPVSLDFAGDAHMILKPEDYMLQQQSIGGASVWCIGFQKSKGQGITILGDLVLKDKIVVYDLGGQRIGWTNYDCSSAVNVSNAKSPGKKQSVNAGLFGSSSSRSTLDYSLLVSVAAASLLFHISSFGSFPFL